MISTSTPFLSPGLARLADPSLDRIHKLGEQAKAMVDIPRTENFSEMVSQFETALKWLKDRQREEV